MSEEALPKNVSKVMGGFIVYIWDEGRKIVGYGKTVEEAWDDLRRVERIIRDVKSRPLKTREYRR